MKAILRVPISALLLAGLWLLGAADPFLLLDSGALLRANERGFRYIEDSLRLGSTQGVLPWQGREAEVQMTADGLLVKTGNETVSLVARTLPMLGFRSTWASLRFQSLPAQGGHLELRLVVRDTNINGRPFGALTVQVRGSYLRLHSPQGEPLAEAGLAAPGTLETGAWYRLEAALFEKGIYVRLLRESDSTAVASVAVPDRQRFIPGHAGIAVAGDWLLRDFVVSPLAPRVPQLCAIGDSITAGLAGGPERESYVHLLSRALQQPLTCNMGSGGASTRLDLQRWPFEIAPFQPRWVWIESGTNDLSAGQSAEAIAANFRAMVKLQGAGVLLSTVPPRNSYTSAQAAERQRLNAWIRNSGFPFVDRDALLRDPTQSDRLNPAFDAGDGTHLNPEGNRRVAQAAVAILAPLVAR